MAQFPNTTTADGIWTLKKVRRAILGDNWPEVIVAEEFFKNTVLLLQADDFADGSQNNTFLDSSTNTHTITRNGNVTQGSFSPFSQDESKWGVYCLGGFVKTNNNITLGTNDFTIEFWVYPNDLNSSILWSDWRTSTTQAVPTIYSGNGILFYYTNGGSRITAPTSLVTNQWQHIAVERVSGTTTLYLDGVSQGTYADSINYIGAQAAFGGYIISPNSFRTNGYMSNARVVNGSAIYNGAFTPPTAPLTNVTNTAVLTCQSNRFVDSSGSHSIVLTDVPEVAPFSPFAPSTAYDPATKGGSGYFDGTGDYLSVANDASLNVLGSSFTIECWFNLSEAQSDAGLVSKHDGSGGYIIRLDTTFVRFYTTAGTIDRTYSFNQGEWHHVAVVSNGTTGTMYINGVAQGATFSTNGTNATSALQIGRTNTVTNDFGGYISNVRITNTAVYTSAFTPPAAPLTEVSGTSLLCNFTNAGIYDGTGRNVLETVGNAQVDTAVFKYGTGSMQFDGTGDALTIPASSLFAFGTGDLTIEFWGYFNSIDNFDTVYIHGNDTNTVQLFFVSGKLRYNNNSVAAVLDTTTTIPTGQWVHLAIVRSSGTATWYLNGTADGTTSDSTNWSDFGTALTIGRDPINGRDMNGYIDDLRITKGVARYTANFTPPAAKLKQQ